MRICGYSGLAGGNQPIGTSKPYLLQVSNALVSFLTQFLAKAYCEILQVLAREPEAKRAKSRAGGVVLTRIGEIRGNLKVWYSRPSHAPQGQWYCELIRGLASRNEQVGSSQ